jgi:RNA-splicing ligase RtcB
MLRTDRDGQTVLGVHTGERGVQHQLRRRKKNMGTQKQRARSESMRHKKEDARRGEKERSVQQAG